MGDRGGETGQGGRDGLEDRFPCETREEEVQAELGFEAGGHTLAFGAVPGFGEAVRHFEPDVGVEFHVLQGMSG